MHKSTFNDDQLEKLLRNMPKVKDTQDPEQLFANISSRLEEKKIDVNGNDLIKTPKRKRTWILPTLASIAAIIIVSLVIPSFLYEQDSATEEVNKKANVQKSIIGEKQEEPENFTMMAEEGMMTRMAFDGGSHLITELPEDQEIITVAVPDVFAQFIVPISFIVPKDGEMTNLERIETIQEHLHEEDWGLSSYILENVKFSEEQMDNGVKKLIIDVPENHPYGNGSAMEIMFLSTVKEMAKQLGVSTVEFRTDSKPGIMLGNYGELKVLDLEKEKAKRLYYIFQPNGQIQKFLVPFPKEVEFTKALEEMKLPMEIDLQQIKPAIPESIQFKSVGIDPSTHHAVIEFAEGTTLTNDETNLLMVEAILMTAKEHGAQTVEFKNATVDFIGPFNMLESIQVPLAVNPMPY
ncbi:hypothetical protein P9E76_04985 [Schinkia azotoformans]|uniref:Negative regulator of sigma-X activity n=1 Tax=Schinkia azotoformans LMG 9581 TaxID=1131731 RepID=K6DH34_SCHAZ|nr:hypothetical protein [Schinkia azotoformans]EKN67408.1 negative regulator of sigma-X activity [Schinkia azotoformans LMG 9581]MEC1639340.1 hypothetical protein [Schinkia azotoformans]MEC1719697.1 hypothetical protein [Schinkia azotoformans]MEC1944406.1 hypothetical protein [Schinkia azotoformans]MED4412838.1 hypothetical protein [Schinkia azotoformans]